MGQGLVPHPADERPGEQGEGAGGQSEAVGRALQQGGAQDVGEAGQREDHSAQEAGGQGHLPGVGLLRFGEGPRHPGVELLGEAEGVLAAVGEADVLVGHPVGFEDGGDLVRVDGGRDEPVEAFDEFVHRVGGGRARAGAAGAGDGGERVAAGDAQPEGSAHHRLPSAASSRYQGSASRWVQSPRWAGRTGRPARFSSARPR